MPSPTTRIATDVWEIAEDVATRMGLGSPRTAIEAVMRVYAADYIQGDRPAPAPQPAPVPSKSTAGPDCASALDQLLNP